MVNFLSEDCIAGQSLLLLVARGSSIIAEMLRLSQKIPPIFKQELYADVNIKTKPPKEISSFVQRGFHKILLDFRYLKNPELYDAKIEASTTIRELDQDFRDSYLEVLKQFYTLFESIYKYIVDLLRYLDDLEQGVFIQLTLENVLVNLDGKQLMAEAIYLYGVMLLLLDIKMEGPIRERMLMCYLRYKGQAETPLLDEVCKLCRATGFIPSSKFAPDYPDTFFKRFPIPESVVRMVVGRLRSDDIYNLVSAYPNPEHRSAAFANQAAMLSVILYFAPDILNGENSIMREIVDKYFPDNWVVNYYMGETFDLSSIWASRPAARAALGNTLTPSNIQKMVTKHNGLLNSLSATLDQYLTEGVMTEDYVLENNAKLLRSAREFNVTIRWLMLHSNTKSKKIQEVVTKDFKRNEFLNFLMKTSQFEYDLERLYQNLLQKKAERWNVFKKEGIDRMNELATYFSGEMALTRVKKNENLRSWFENIGNQINSLDIEDSTLAGRKIQQITQALEEVEQYHQIESNLQVKQFIEDTTKFLEKMIKIVNVKDEYLGILSIIMDLNFGWLIIQTYVNSIQMQIRQDPKCILMIRSTFLKLSKIMELPLYRIIQCNSADLPSVSKFYSHELIGFVRVVLSIIPRSMFIILSQIIEVQTNKLSELPTKVEKEKFLNYVQSTERYDLARATHAISVFTEGILAMNKTLMGVVEVDPKQMLEDGIRKELVTQIATAMDSTLVFKTGKISEFTSQLNTLAALLDGFRRSFQYIQDYVNIYGLKIWQEEFFRIVNYNVEQECNLFLKKKVEDFQSRYQSLEIPIPTFPSQDPSCQTFIGRLARQILNQTSFTRYTYFEMMSGWFNEKGGETIGIRQFSLLMNAVGVFGVVGLDRLLCFKIVRELQDLVSLVRVETSGLGGHLTAVRDQLHPTTSVPQNPDKFYPAAGFKLKKLFTAIVNPLCVIGQLQLLRRFIASLLNFTCKVDSKQLFHSLEAMNISILQDVQSHYKDELKYPYPSEDNLEQLTSLCEVAGISDPLSKIYVTLVECNIPRKKGGFDITPLVIGLATFMKQFHSIHTNTMSAYLGQYTKAFIAHSAKGPKSDDFMPEVRQALLFIELFQTYHKGTARKTLEAFLPPYILDTFTKLKE